MHILGRNSMGDVEYIRKLESNADSDVLHLKFAYHPYQPKGYLVRMINELTSRGVEVVNVRKGSFLPGYTIEANNGQSNGIKCKCNYKDIFATIKNLVEG